MTYTKAIMAAVATVCCLGAVTSAGASAAIKKGELVNKSGNALVKKHFTASATETVLQTVSEVSVKCKKGTAVGEVSGKTSATQTYTFSECKDSLGQKCKTEGLGAEEIRVGGVEQEIGYKSSGKETTTEEELVIASTIKGTLKFTCGTASAEVKGTFAEPVGKAQEESLKSAYSFTGKQNAPGEPELESYVGVKNKKLKDELVEVLLGSESFQKAAWTGTETLGLEEEAKFL